MINKIEKLKELASSLNVHIDSQRSKTAKLEHVRNQIVNQFRKDFEVGTISDTIAAWDKLTWEEFDKETMRLVGVTTTCMSVDWQEYFLLEKEKAEQLRNEIEEEDKEINRLLAELHSLTKKKVVI